MDTRPLSNQYTELSRHRKAPSATSSTIDEVEAHAKSIGIIDLDNPDVKKKTVIADLSNFERARYEAQKERERLEAEAQEKYKQALVNLDNGTAVHRVKRERTKPAAKSKTVRPAAAPKRKYTSRAESVLTFDKEKATTRRMDIMQTLKSGGKIEYKKQQDCEGGYAEYQTQYTDIRWLIRVKKLDITRIQSIDNGQSYFVLDNFERYNMPRQISGYLNDADSKQSLITALLSKQIVCTKDITATNKVGARSVATLASTYGLDVYTVFDSRNVSGWIAIDKPIDPIELKRLQDISDLVDAIDATEHLKNKQRLKAYRLPMCVPDVILDAVFREFKRVEKDGQ